MPKRHKPYSQYRGTIIVDSSALFYLFCPVAEAHMNRQVQADKRAAMLDAPVTRIRHYLGALDYLAEQGYHIIVPEMVAAETASVLACGSSVLDHAEIPLERRKKLHSPQLTSIIKRAIRGKPNMSLVEFTNATDEYARASQNAVDSLRRVLNHPKGSDDAAFELLGWRLNRYNKNLGEQAILGYINEAKLQGKQDVFVLSNDKIALEKISRESGVAVMNSNGFMSAILSSGVGKAMGLIDRLPTREVMNACAEHKSKVTGQLQHPNLRKIDHRNHEGDFGEHGEGKDAFRTQMDALAEELQLKSWVQKSRLPTVNVPSELHTR